MKRLALIEYFNRILPLDEKEIAILMTSLKKEKLKKAIYSSRKGNL